MTIERHPCLTLLQCDTASLVQGELRARGEYVRTYRGPLNGLLVMLRTDGLMALQAGLAPAMLYQFVMNGLRLGSYAMLEAGGWVKV